MLNVEVSRGLNVRWSVVIRSCWRTWANVPDMAGLGDMRLSRRLTNLSALLLGLVGMGLGVFALWAGQGTPLSPAWSSLVTNVGGLVFATSLITVGWELTGKRSFAAEVMAMAGLGSDVSRAGISTVTDQYLDDVEWDELFRGAEKVDIVVAYANTWRHAHWARLVRLAATKGARLRVFLPDPDDQPTMDALARRFNSTTPEITSKVREAIHDFSSLSTTAGAEVSVHTRPGDMLFSCYRFDGSAVLTLYSHRRSRTSVPTWVVRQGTLFQFVYEEVSAIKEQSTLVETNEGSESGHDA